MLPSSEPFIISRFSFLGGWTLMTTVSGGATNFVANSLSHLFSLNGSIALKTSQLKELQNIINFKQLRFYCHKKSHGRYLDIATALSISGYKVVDYFTNKTHNRPHACGSYYRLPIDSSQMSQQCSNWTIGAWAHDFVPREWRLFDHPFYIHAELHYVIFHGRFECDDWDGAYDSSDRWKIFVR